ncbi:hypothetical protein I7I48_05423 [Histoplasma ohiense]|nr:hypothetical protein I7I48_05423 [Histoplasma ohiense (nom. inval.)]
MRHYRVSGRTSRRNHYSWANFSSLSRPLPMSWNLLMVLHVWLNLCCHSSQEQQGANKVLFENDSFSSLAEQ